MANQFKCLECGELFKLKYWATKAAIPHKARPLECPKCKSVKIEIVSWEY